MRREGRVRGKPTNKSRLTGRCQAGKTRCRCCRDHPVEKSRDKRMGRYKRFAVDVRINPALAEFLLQPPFALLPSRLMDREDEPWYSCHEGAMDVLALTVNSMIEAAFVAKLHRDDFEMDQNAAMACTTHELATNGGCTLSEESWSDVDLLESEQGSSVEDDWSMVDDDGDDV